MSHFLKLWCTTCPNFCTQPIFIFYHSIYYKSLKLQIPSRGNNIFHLQISCKSSKRSSHIMGNPNNERVNQMVNTCLQLWRIRWHNDTRWDEILHHAVYISVVCKNATTESAHGSKDETKSDQTTFPLFNIIVSAIRMPWICFHNCRTTTWHTHVFRKVHANLWGIIVLIVNSFNFTSWILMMMVILHVCTLHICTYTSTNNK